MIASCSIEGSSDSSIRDVVPNDLARILCELGPCDVVMADIDDNTPDSRVAFFARAAASLLP